MTDIANADVARTFASCPPPLRRKLLALRELVLDTALTYRRKKPRA